MVKRPIVVAASVSRAAHLAAELGLANANPFPTSPRAIRSGGGGRGLNADLILIDESAMPLPDDVRAALIPTLIAGGGQMYSIARIP